MRKTTAKPQTKPRPKPRATKAPKVATKAAKVAKPAAKAKTAKPTVTPQPAAEVLPPTPAPAAPTPAQPAVKAPTAAQLDRRTAREAKERAAKIDVLEKALHKRGDSRCVNLLGRAAGPGWVLSATDGHRALLRPGTATTAGSVPPGFLTVAALGIDFTQDVVASLRRMVAAGSKEMQFTTTLALTDINAKSTSGVLRLSVKNPNAGVEEATETVEVDGTGLRVFTAAVNGKYLLQASGLYPSRLHVSEASGAALFQVVAPEARILIVGFGKSASFPAGEAKARPVVAANIGEPMPVEVLPATITAAESAAIATPKTPRVRTAAPAGDLTACECCGQPSRARTATTGKTRFSHKCPHGNPCPTGVAKKTIAACPICRDRGAQVPADTAVSA